MDSYEQLTALFESEDGELFRPKAKQSVVTDDNRLVESFNEITKFVQENNRKPDINAADLKEAALGMRLSGIISNTKKFDALIKYDNLGLLELEKPPASLDELFSNDAGIFSNNDIFQISKLPRAGVSDKNKGDVATKKKVEDFGSFKAMFEEKQNGLKIGTYKLVRFRTVDELVLHGFYIVDGMMCYVEQIGKTKKVFGRQKERLRVIYENGTESDIYLRTLSSELYKNGFIVVQSDQQNEQNQSKSEKDLAAGYIYVLKSLSQNPTIASIKDLYKIGVTTTTIEDRIKDAANDPTYLMSDVELVDSYELLDNIKPQKVEAMIQKFFSDARVVMEIIDKDGYPYTPQEWYCVPIEKIEEAVDLIRTGEIVNYAYRDGEIKEG